MNAPGQAPGGNGSRTDELRVWLVHCLVQALGPDGIGSLHWKVFGPKLGKVGPLALENCKLSLGPVASVRCGISQGSRWHVRNKSLQISESVEMRIAQAHIPDPPGQQME